MAMLVVVLAVALNIAAVQAAFKSDNVIPTIYFSYTGHMAKLNFEWLEVFVQIYKTKSVSRAASQLGMEQATASIALNKLRQHFDDRLFVRTADGMIPTPRAQLMFPELQEALARIEAARGKPAAFAPANAVRQFRICMTDISEIIILPRLVNYLQKNAPGLVIEAEKISVDSRQRLASGDVDLAVGFLPDLEAGFYEQSLFEEDFVCLAAKNHPRVQGKLSPRVFSKEGHILVTTSGTGHAIVDKVFARQQIERRVVLRVPSFLGVARIVAQTDFLVVVPRLLGMALASQEHVQVLEPPTRLPHYKVKQHWHERFNADPASIWLRQTLAKLFMRPGKGP
ncbi:LysR family transcriptional regulator [soil metagenome]